MAGNFPAEDEPGSFDQPYEISVSLGTVYYNNIRKSSKAFTETWDFFYMPDPSWEQNILRDTYYIGAC